MYRPDVKDRRGGLKMLMEKDTTPINVEETVRYHVSDIRRKLTEMSGKKFIETVWGIGYRFCDMV